LPVPLTVFVDANVLYSRCLRDWLILMALDSHYTAYAPRWSEAVLAEAFYLDQAGAGISVLHVDEFLCLVADRYPELVRRRYLSQIMYWQRRHRMDEETAADSCLESLDRAGAKSFSFLLRTHERFRVW
jgi:hypothetical protein